MSVIQEIAAERQRQIDEEGWVLEADDRHEYGEMAEAAACYASQRRTNAGRPFAGWPWAWNWWKPKDRRRDLIRAGALIVAEIERLDRLEQSHD